MNTKECCIGTTQAVMDQECVCGRRFGVHLSQHPHVYDGPGRKCRRFRHSGSSQREVRSR